MTEPVIVDIDTPLKVEYCIPLWLRDEQIKVNITQVPGRIQEHVGIREGRVAIACYGPSLNDTWEQLRAFPQIMTCSGSHKFLLERGIVPTWHVEVDPRKHKIELLGPPHKDVCYLIASACHPDYVKYIADSGAQVLLWHVFDNSEEAARVLPPGEWSVTGGANVGLRALMLARFSLGYTDLHIFGMDGCEGPSGKHAAAHPNQPKTHILTEYPKGSGTMWRTTVGMLECAKGTFHELNQLPNVQTTFYGEGLVQAMAKDYQPNKVPVGQLAARTPELITPEFRALNAKLHRDNLAYGVGGGRHADTVIKMAKSLSTSSVLDYGCGKGYLAKQIPFPIWEYDPAIPGKDTLPRPADLVVCTDVLEHVEPEKLKMVLLHLAKLTKQAGYLVIHTGPAKKTYDDGRNTHLTQRGIDWWRAKLGKVFHVGKIIPKGIELHVIVRPKDKPKPGGS